MEITFDTILSIVTLLLGGGGGAFFTWRYQRKKAKAEATTAEADAAKQLQEVYGRLINDVKADRDEQKAYIQELKNDRKILRDERNELRKRQDELEENVRQLRLEVARNGRMMGTMRPFLCGKAHICQDRIPATIDIPDIEDYGNTNQQKLQS